MSNLELRRRNLESRWQVAKSLLLVKRCKLDIYWEAIS
jgi:hypothetical protein